MKDPLFLSRLITLPPRLAKAIHERFEKNRDIIYPKLSEVDRDMITFKSYELKHYFFRIHNKLGESSTYKIKHLPGSPDSNEAASAQYAFDGVVGAFDRWIQMCKDMKSLFDHYSLKYEEEYNKAYSCWNVNDNNANDKVPNELQTYILGWTTLLLNENERLIEQLGQEKAAEIISEATKIKENINLFSIKEIAEAFSKLHTTVKLGAWTIFTMITTNLAERGVDFGIDYTQETIQKFSQIINALMIG